jgi:hypothetical protein
VFAGASFGVLVLAIVGAIGLSAAALPGMTFASGETFDEPMGAPPTRTPSPIATPTEAATPIPTPTETARPNADILRPGDVLLTYEELIAWAKPHEARLGDIDQWAQMSLLIMQCMASKGYWDDPRVMPAPPNTEPVPWPEGYREALGGSTGSGDAWDWQDAGCGGYAIHELGITS